MANPNNKDAAALARLDQLLDEAKSHLSYGQGREDRSGIREILSDVKEGMEAFYALGSTPAVAAEPDAEPVIFSVTEARELSVVNCAKAALERKIAVRKRVTEISDLLRTSLQRGAAVRAAEYALGPFTFSELSPPFVKAGYTAHPRDGGMVLSWPCAVVAAAPPTTTDAPKMRFADNGVINFSRCDLVAQCGGDIYW